MGWMWQPCQDGMCARMWLEWGSPIRGGLSRLGAENAGLGGCAWRENPDLQIRCHVRRNMPTLLEPLHPHPTPPPQTCLSSHLPPIYLRPCAGRPTSGEGRGGQPWPPSNFHVHPLHSTAPAGRPTSR